MVTVTGRGPYQKDTSETCDWKTRGWWYRSWAERIFENEAWKRPAFSSFEMHQPAPRVDKQEIVGQWHIKFIDIYETWSYSLTLRCWTCVHIDIYIYIFIPFDVDMVNINISGILTVVHVECTDQIQPVLFFTELGRLVYILLLYVSTCLWCITLR